MRISNNKLNSALEKESLQELWRNIGHIRSIGDVERFLDVCFTEDEKLAVLRRFAVIRLLQSGKTYTEIKDVLEVSRNTISNARDMIDGRGYGKNPKRTRIYSSTEPPKKEKTKPVLTRKYKGASSIF